MALIVQKYGGTSVGNPERIKNVARRVARAHAEGHKLVVVVSAMSGETNRLVALAKEVQTNPDPRELDVVISTGEQVTIGLLCMALEDIVKKSSGGIYNNAAQVWNHTFFWNSLKPAGGGAPSGKLAEAINSKWGSFDAFKEAFTKSAVGNFGSSWTWLVKKADGSVDILNTGAAGNPLTTGDVPLIAIDLWEHAYYIDYRNARPKFVETFLTSLANWDFAAANFA